MSTASLAPPGHIRAIVAASLGNFVELFDLTVFGFFATTIGAQFFPSTDPAVSLLSAFATFGVGFLMRPAGAFLLAQVGDRHGRKRLLVLTMTLMTVATLGITVLPPYSVIGVAAPALLVAFRLLQGLAAGGEWGGAVSMIVENAPAGRRGFVGSFQQVGFGLGTLAGTLCSFAIGAGMSAEALAAWGWRIPFAAGLLLAPITLYIRRSVGETADFQAAVAADTTTRSPVRAALAEHKPAIFAVVGVGVLGTAAGYLGNQFLTSFASSQLGLARGSVTGIILLGAAVQTVLIPVWGLVSDRFGRFSVIGGAALVYGIVIYPMFRLLANAPSAATLTVVVLVNSVLVAASFGPLPAAISEMFPTEVRATALSIGYNVAVALFGGFAPYIATMLVDATGSNTSPTYYGLLCAVLTIATCATLLRHRRATGSTREAVGTA